MRPVPLVLSLAFGLAACGTPEYRAEQSVCEAQWLQKIPPRYERQIVERVRYIQVPTGVSTCTTNAANVQTCVAQMRSEAIPYTAVETVDVNKASRDVQIRACAVKACTARYGNPECRTGS
ncbi:MAG: hypothetical protein Q8K20_05180 [Gemmobacter sp.]|nr:hypothetical protein [Gemmobacter sp.]